MNDKDKNGFGIFGAIVVGVAAVAATVAAVNKKKKSKSKINFFKDELVKLPVFKKVERSKKEVVDEEEDIFEDEDYIATEEKKSFFNDTDEVSYEEDEEFQSVSHAAPITTPIRPVAEEVVEEPVIEEVVEEPVIEEVVEEPVIEEVVEEPVIEEAVEEPVIEEVVEEPVIEEVVEEEQDDTFVFESVIVGTEVEKTFEESKASEVEEPDISDVVPSYNDTIDSVVAEPERTTPAMNIAESEEEPAEEEPEEEPAEEEPAEEPVEEELVRINYGNTPVIDELIKAAMEEVTGNTYQSEKAVEEVKTETVIIEDVAEEPVKEPIVEDVVEEDFDDEIRAHESYYDWIYNVDEHYSVITDGKWVYCKSDDVLTSTSVNKKGGRETIDIAETFKNRIKEDGYCLLKYIGTETDVVIPSTINGKPVVATMNTFRSNQTIKKVTIPSTMLGLRRTFYSCYHLDKIIFEPGTKLVYELDSIMCGNNDMDSNTESTTVICSPEIASYFRGHYKLGCPVIFNEK